MVQLSIIWQAKRTHLAMVSPSLRQMKSVHKVLMCGLTEFKASRTNSATIESEERTKTMTSPMIDLLLDGQKDTDRLRLSLSFLFYYIRKLEQIYKQEVIIAILIIKDHTR